MEYKPPLRFIAHYEGECGEGYEMIGVSFPTLKLPCEECGKTHKFKLMYIEHGIGK